jgi:hypothetical protein
MPNNRNLKDASLKVTKPLPASTTATATDGINLQNSTKGDFVAPVEFLLTAPALSTAQLPDTKTMTYTVETDTDSAFGSAKVVMTLNSLTQTGAGGAGAVGGSERFRLPTNVEQYVRAKVTPSASGTGDASGVSMTLEVLS